MIFAFLLLFILWVPQARALNYQDLSIQERMEQIQAAKDIAAQQQQEKEQANATSSAFEEEKKTISQQLAVITGDEDTKYAIVPGDTLKVDYSDQGNTVENVYQVNNDGVIGMPLIGEVKISGMNRMQARAYLNARMGEYIRNPQLSLQINISGKYMVVGAAGPGVFELQPNLRLMEALLKAGIEQNRANLSSVMVMRQGKDKPLILRLNIKKMMIRGDISDNIAIKPNDIIYVPNSLFFDIDSFKDKLFQYITDYYTLGGATILKQTTTPQSQAQ